MRVLTCAFDIMAALFALACSGMVAVAAAVLGMAVVG